MARTVEKWTRVYIDGFDVSGYGRTIGPLEVTYDEADLTAQMSDTVRGYLRNRAAVNLGIFNAIFDNTATTGIHTVLQSAGDARTVLVAKGVQAAPVDGDHVFGGVFEQGAYQVEEDGGAVTVSIPWVGWAADAASLLFANPWGLLLHASAARTSGDGVNAANSGISNPEGGATSLGGYFLYSVLAGSGGDGTATLSVDDSANNSDWTALSGATSGEIDCRDRQAGIVALTPAATVREYLRWQIAFNGATEVTWVAAFMRAF
jgi:hypothetical protein